MTDAALSASTRPEGALVSAVGSGTQATCEARVFAARIASVLPLLKNEPAAAAATKVVKTAGPDVVTDKAFL